MSGADAVALVVGLVGVAVLALAVVAAISLRRTVAALQAAVDELHDETVPLVRELRGAVEETNADLHRMGGLIEAAEAVSSNAQAASRLAYLTFSNPVVKAMALGSGVARAGRRIRRGEG